MYKFEPLLKQTLWGGDKIIPFKHLDTQMENVGESWEISGVENNETIVANGPEKGKSLNQLVREHKDELVGKDNYSRFGNEFPLSHAERPRCGMRSNRLPAHNSITA